MSAFEYQLQRSMRRKTLSIVIRRGEVKVLAPVFLSKNTIAEFVVAKTPWILQKLQTQQAWVEQNEQGQKQFVDGEVFLYLGESYPLSVGAASKSEVTFHNGYFIVNVSNRVKPENSSNHIKGLLQDWYKQQLSDYLDHRIEHYTKLIGVVHTGVNVRAYTRRWGSCSSKGQLSFNFLLMMAPAWVIDYVIVHELCHLTHMNHSPRFWAKVLRFYPRHKEAKAWLKIEGGNLRLE
jgi:predicted metal-dependent hydrolase